MYLIIEVMTKHRKQFYTKVLTFYQAYAIMYIVLNEDKHKIKHKQGKAI